MFNKRRYLMDHLRRTHKTPVYGCEGCSEKFASRGVLLKHIHKCERYKERKKRVGQEELGHVLTKRKKNNQCHVCQKWFLTQALLQAHREKEHLKQLNNPPDNILKNDEENINPANDKHQG